MPTRRKGRQGGPPTAKGVFYAFKLCPVPTGAGPLDLYVGMRDGWIAPIASEATEAGAMRQLAHHGAGYELLCERRLARSGKPFGFAPAEAPEWASAVQCGLSVCMALGPSMGPDCMLPAGELVKASAKFLKAAPWQHWHADLALKFEVSGLVEHALEGCIMGSGGSEFGIVLYEEPGAMAKLVKLHKAGRPQDAAKLKCIAVTFNPAPDFARDVLQQAIGVPVVPVPTRVERGRMGPPSAVEILTLAGALAAASGLTPTTPVAIGGVSDGRGSVTVKITATS